MWRDFYSRFVGQFSGGRALRQAAEQNRLERFFTFRNFEESANRCGRELEKAGLSDVAVESFPADGVTSWYGWQSMKAWDVEEAQLRMIVPHRELLCDWSLVPESLVMYSGSCDVEGEIVDWDGDEAVNLAGKIPFTRHRILLVPVIFSRTCVRNFFHPTSAGNPLPTGRRSSTIRFPPIRIWIFRSRA